MSEPTAESGPTATRAAWWGLGILTFINLFNYLDRYVLSALVESLRKDPIMQLTDTQAGWLMPGFVLVYMMASPVFGTLGDRQSRPRLIALGVAIWSIATVCGGLVGSFIGLFVARAAVGVGEAAYGTIAPAMLADYFPKTQRGRVFAIFFCAIPVGSALGYVLGGLIDQAYGWRAAFFVAGAPGILLALAVMWLKDPVRGGQDEGDEPAPEKPGLKTYLDLLKNRAYVWSVVGYGAYTFALGGLAFWAPAFLERVRGLPKEDATVTFGGIVVVTGFVGTAIGGWLGDRLLTVTRQSYLWVSGVATLLAAPATWFALTSPDKPVYMTALVIAQVLLFVSTGPINSAIVNLVSAHRRASAIALSILIMHLLGDVPSPPLIGWLSDRDGLGSAVLVVPFAVAVSGLVWCHAARVAARLAPPEAQSPGPA